MKGKILKEMVENIFQTMKEKYPAFCEIEDAIYYRNGKNGTDFDWNVNNHVSSFFLYYRKSEMGYIGVSIGRDGSVDAYYYEDEHMLPSGNEHFQFGSAEAYALAKFLYSQMDERYIWDKSIEGINWDIETDALQVSALRSREE